MTIAIEMDVRGNAAYISLSDAPVESTVALNVDTLVDLDADGGIVGVELLRRQAPIPVDSLVERFGLPREPEQVLRLLGRLDTGDIEVAEAPPSSRVHEVTDLTHGAA